jgi:SWI/SNF-related matrix-associated actin-dependent regulator 1 of chromatin subfamily A
MQVTYERGMYVARGFRDPAPFHKKGWVFRSVLNGWMTTNIENVLPLFDYCVAEAAARVGALRTQRIEAIADSIAVDVDEDFPAPPGLKYRPYQKAGIAYMLERLRAGRDVLNADVMRLGKTVQSMGVINSLTPQRVLVICPANAKSVWRDHMRDWLIEPRTVGVAEGNNLPNTEYTIINYDIISRHLEALKSVVWDLIILDESKALKNPGSKRTKNILDSSGRSRRIPSEMIPARLGRIFLDGTPVYTRIIDLWPVVQRCDPQGLGSNYWNFIRRYCGANELNDWDTSGAINLEELQRKLRSTFMIRREKHHVGKEVEPFRQVISLPKAGLKTLLDAEARVVAENIDSLMKLDQSGVLDASVVDEILGRFVTNEGDEALSVIEASGALATVRRELAIAKLPMCIDWITNLLQSEEKVVVFAHHRDVVAALHEAFPGSARVWGGMTTKKRDAEVAKFKTDPECRVFVGNIMSAGQAISLSVADVVVFCELSWIPAEMDQAEERIWTTEKQYPLSVYWLTVEDSLDYIMSAVLMQRQKDIRRTVSDRALDERIKVTA